MVYTHHIFIHFSADGHLSCFHVFAIVNSASVNTGVHVVLSSFLDMCPGVGLLDLIVTIELGIF